MNGKYGITPKETSSSSSSTAATNAAASPSLLIILPYTLFFRIEKNHPRIVFFC
jgi:hypothetical protein